MIKLRDGFLLELDQTSLWTPGHDEQAVRFLNPITRRLLTLRRASPVLDHLVDYRDLEVNQLSALLRGLGAKTVSNTETYVWSWHGDEADARSYSPPHEDTDRRQTLVKIYSTDGSGAGRSVQGWVTYPVRNVYEMVTLAPRNRAAGSGAWRFAMNSGKGM